MPLVKLFLNRYNSGEKGDYVTGSGDAYDYSLGEAYPAHYYKQVVVCENCYKVYCLIDKARDRAIKKINKKAQYQKSGQLNKDHQTMEDEFFQDQMGSEEEELLEGGMELDGRRGVSFDLSQSSDESVGASSQTMEAQALAIAEKAIASISKMDIAELKAFSKPPSAVKIVIEALLYLLR